MPVKFNLVKHLLIVVLILFSSVALPVGATTDPSAAPCTHFVDNQAGADGTGSATDPWDNIVEHTDDLSPGDVMCIRGDLSGSGRVYPTKYLELNQSGTAYNPITIRPYPGEKVILKAVEGEGLIKFKGVGYWIIEDLVVDNNGNWARAIVLQEGSHHNIIRNNEIRNGHTDGITLLYDSPNNVIENNYIHDFLSPDLDLDAHCILIHVGSDNVIIRSNTFHDCSGNGVQLIRDKSGNSDPARDVQIVENVFSRGTFVRIQAAISVKAATNLTVAGNRIFGFYDHNAINHGGSSKDTVFENNIIYGSARGFRIEGQSEGMVLRNNLIHDVTDYGIQVHGVKDGTFVHNTIVGAQQHAFRVVLSGLEGGRIQNNLFVDSGKVQLDENAPFSNVTVGYNGWFNTSADSIFKSPTDVVWRGSPYFAATGDPDYHLTAGSPARDAGTDLGVTTDIEGDPRPLGSGPDIGADEFIPLLMAVPDDTVIRLSWAGFEHPDATGYVISYTYSSGGKDADQGPSPLNVPLSSQEITLTGLSNYVFYTFTVAAQDAAGNDLLKSVSQTTMPTDIFAYLPLILKRHP